jgi:hypothetical protein
MQQASVVGEQKCLILTLAQVFEYAVQSHPLGIFSIFFLVTVILEPGDYLLEFLIQLTFLSVLMGQLVYIGT